MTKSARTPKLSSDAQGGGEARFESGDDKDANPFLAGVLAIIEALKFGQIECRVYDREKFHAKTYHFGGDTNGQSINDVWWLMNPAGEAIV